MPARKTRAEEPPRRSSKPKVLAPGEKLKVLENAAGTLASDWSLLDAYNILEYKRSEQSKQAKKLAERDRMKTELRMQLAKKQNTDLPTLPDWRLLTR